VDFPNNSPNVEAFENGISKKKRTFNFVTDSKIVFDLGLKCFGKSPAAEYWKESKSACGRVSYRNTRKHFLGANFANQETARSIEKIYAMEFSGNKPNYKWNDHVLRMVAHFDTIEEWGTVGGHTEPWTDPAKCSALLKSITNDCTCRTLINAKAIARTDKKYENSFHGELVPFFTEQVNLDIADDDGGTRKVSFTASTKDAKKSSASGAKPKHDSGTVVRDKCGLTLKNGVLGGTYIGGPIPDTYWKASRKDKTRMEEIKSVRANRLKLARGLVMCLLLPQFFVRMLVRLWRMRSRNRWLALVRALGLGLQVRSIRGSVVLTGSDGVSSLLA
jgi:hypothetical protein